MSQRPLKPKPKHLVGHGLGTSGGSWYWNRKPTDEGGWQYWDGGDPNPAAKAAESGDDPMEEAMAVAPEHAAAPPGTSPGIDQFRTSFAGRTGDMRVKEPSEYTEEVVIVPGTGRGRLVNRDLHIAERWASLTPDRNDVEVRSSADSEALAMTSPVMSVHSGETAVDWRPLLPTEEEEQAEPQRLPKRARSSSPTVRTVEGLKRERSA